MDVYISFITKSFKKMFAYRINSFLSVLSAIIRLLIQMSLWTTLIKAGTGSVHITLPQMTTYIFINSLVLSFSRSNMGNTLGSKIKNGTIAIDILRPINLKLYLFAEELGENIFNTLFTILPVCLVLILFYRISLPPSPVVLGFFVTSLLNGIIIIYYINYISGLSSFWTRDCWYISFYHSALFTLFGGTFVPVWFYPKGLAALVAFLPFKYVSFTPISIYLGQLSLHEILITFVIQVFWIVVLYLFGRVLWVRAQKKIIIQGG